MDFLCEWQYMYQYVLMSCIRVFLDTLYIFVNNFVSFAGHCIGSHLYWMFLLPVFSHRN